MELPDTALHTAGIAPGLFFMTPKLTGCNIFVAHDPGMHKFYVFRVGGKHPHKPPDMNNNTNKVFMKWLHVKRKLMLIKGHCKHETIQNREVGRKTEIFFRLQTDESIWRWRKEQTSH